MISRMLGSRENGLSVGQRCIARSVSSTTVSARRFTLAERNEGISKCRRCLCFSPSSTSNDSQSRIGKMQPLARPAKNLSASPVRTR